MANMSTSLEYYSRLEWLSFVSCHYKYIAMIDFLIKLFVMKARLNTNYQLISFCICLCWAFPFLTCVFDIVTFSFTPLHSVIGQFLVWLPYFPRIYRKPLSFLYLQQSTSVSIRCIFKTFLWSQLLCTKSAFIPQRGGMQISLSLYFADSFRAATAFSSDARLYQILCMRELGEE